MDTTIIHGDCLEIMRSMEDNSINFIVTDPPYGLKFMGKGWDHCIPGVEFWREALRICKPGSFLLAFGGTRTYHRLTCAIEDAGWEIRDCIMWIYGSGFPKSHNHFGIEGYGTALKPAHEPIIMAMKPIEGTFKQNAEKWGQAGINIDESRIPTNGEKIDGPLEYFNEHEGYQRPWKENKELVKERKQLAYDKANSKGRWPANVIFDEEAGVILDEQSGDASRFFYCAKASSSERNAGLEGLELKQTVGGGGLNNTEDDVCGKYGSIKARAQNHHPTVKPLKLMEYLIKLIAPPGNPILLDPFCGSGSTLVAAQQLGIKTIGIEKEQEYVDIAQGRVNENINLFNYRENQ